MRLCNWVKGRICTEEGESVLIFKEGKRRDAQVHLRTIEKGIYWTLEVTSNGISIFVKKKDSKGMAQNYQYLNEWTIKNNYSLPLLLDILENIGMKKIFTKLNLW